MWVNQDLFAGGKQYTFLLSLCLVFSSIASLAQLLPPGYNLLCPGLNYISNFPLDAHEEDLGFADCAKNSAYASKCNARCQRNRACPDLLQVAALPSIAQRRYQSGNELIFPIRDSGRQWTTRDHVTDSTWVGEHAQSLLFPNLNHTRKNRRLVVENDRVMLALDPRSQPKHPCYTSQGEELRVK